MVTPRDNREGEQAKWERRQKRKEEQRQKIYRERKAWRQYVNRLIREHGIVEVEGKQCPCKKCHHFSLRDPSFGYQGRERVLHYCIEWEFDNHAAEG